MDVSSSNESDSYFQNTKQSLASADGKYIKYRRPIVSERTDEPSKVDIPVSPPSADGKSLYDKEIENSSADKRWQMLLDYCVNPVQM